MKRNTKKLPITYFLRTVSAIAASGCMIGAAIAQDAGTDVSADATADDSDGKFSSLDTITVTARKRSEEAQSVPIAITAVNAEGIENRNLQNVSEIGALSPNMVFDTNPPISGSNAGASVFIRGIGQIDFLMTTEPGVGVYVDGVYLARSVGMALDLVDVERVEILRGPQGTLFGRNTIGGAVSVISKKPGDELSGKLSFTTGSDDRLDVYGSVGGPLSDSLKASLAVSYRSQDGYVKSLQGGRDLGDVNALAGRLALYYEPADNFRAQLNFDATRRREASAGAALLRTIIDPPTGPVPGFGFAYNAIFSGDPACISAATGFGNPLCFNDQWVAGPFATNSTYAAEPANPGFSNRSDLDLWGVGGTLEYDLTGSLTVKSVTSYREMESEFARDADHSPFIINHTENLFTHDQFSQELQLLGDSFDGRLKWVLGGYYFSEDGRDVNNVNFSLVHLRSGGFIDNKSKAVFGQGTFDITSELHLTLGGRYTRDDKNFLPDQYILDPKLTVALGLAAGDRALPMVNYKNEISEFTPYANISYDFAPGSMIYVSYSEGFKSGGFTQRVFPPLLAAPTFKPEFVEVYEAGFKSEPTNWLRVNGAVFQTNYDDIQLLVLLGPALQWVNGSTARIRGAELEYVVLPAEGLLVEGGLGYLDATYKTLTPEAIAFGINPGNRFVNAPEWQLNSAASYSFDIGAVNVTPRIDWSYRTKTYNDAINSPGIVQKAYHVVNANIAVEFSRAKLVFGVSNLTDTLYWTSAFSHPEGGIEEASFARPREWWLKAQASF